MEFLDQPIEFLQPFTTPTRWGFFQAILVVGLLVLILQFYWVLRRARKESSAPMDTAEGTRAAPFICAKWLAGLLFLGILAHQASWQLTGHLRPEFVAFMQRFDHRHFNPAHYLERGKIFDRNGVLLASGETTTTGVHRVYPLGSAAAHPVGYTDAKYGLAGVESAMNDWLTHVEIADRRDVARLSRDLIQGGPRDYGQDVQLTLDARLQEYTYSRFNGQPGAALVMEPNSGAILAWVSAPSFDPNNLSAQTFDANQTDAPLLDRATKAQYPPGSVFKVAIAAAALDRGLDPIFHCPAEGFRPQRNEPAIHDHEYHEYQEQNRRWRGRRNVDIDTALVVSSNVYFAQLGAQLSKLEQPVPLGAKFHLNTEIDILSSNGRGLRIPPSPIPEKLRLSEWAQLGIGQGRAVVSPIQMTLLYAAVANGGIAPKPRLLATHPAESLGQWMKPETARRLRGALRRVVTNGTGKILDIPELRVAGKTGSADNPHGRAHSWFIGIEPWDNPKIVVAVIMENAGYGSQAAAPFARDILLKYHELSRTPAP